VTAAAAARKRLRSILMPSAYRNEPLSRRRDARF
jgi:hypothetical protein